MASEDYIVTEGAQEVLLSQEVFDAVQRQRKQNRATSSFGRLSKGFMKDHENRYEGLLFDVCTGIKMLRFVPWRKGAHFRDFRN
ncbi:hypothetical protein [Murdochiella massiliensis]|uniref:hypothetical protein n=1 Tax=Murdochiella massiliensis TaxID=1673723 RepID=UPI00083036FF|nr:hypothetical protein [Murdochiella massiliensis]